ncbi:MAG: thiamine pyrophosphate-binding protein [Candidatus Polarisedimenticolaceae bacterium]|nr:thiamine pyrophosphate-binding protein [Candidatus Polarisedimenticolaceae bacterium]
MISTPATDYAPEHDPDVALPEASSSRVSRAFELPDTEILEVGDLLIAYLKQLSIKYLFGVPGGAIEPLYNALARQARYDEENSVPEHERGPRAIIARHEADAAFMAEGYARITGKIGVCCATTGPGATNLITGVASAYENRTPLLVITAQSALTNFGRGAMQESSCTGIDTVSMFNSCTRYNTLVSHKEQFERKLAAALLSSRGSPAGPAHLSIPLDVMRGIPPVSKPSYQLTTGQRNHPVTLVDDTVDEVFNRITQTDSQVAFVIGHGCRDAIGAILKVARQINATLVVTPHAKGLINPFQPLFRGVFGFAGHESAAEALAKADTIVAIGITISEWSTQGWDQRLLEEKLIHIDDNQENFTRSPMAGIHLLGDIAGIFSYLMTRAMESSDYNEPSKYNKRNRHDHTISENRDCPCHFSLEDEAAFTSSAIPIKPQRLMHDLPRLLPSNTHYLADAGNSIAWAIHYLHSNDRRMGGKQNGRSSTFEGCLEFATMGWAIGASVGAALGAKERLNNKKNLRDNKEPPIVCITGDGSLLMAGQEITVAVQEALPIIFILLNDSSLGMVKHGQRLGGAEPIGHKLPEIDYCAFAKVLGAYGETVHSPEDLAKLDFNEMLQRPGPTLIDVYIDKDEVPPLASRTKVLLGR